MGYEESDVSFNLDTQLCVPVLRVEQKATLQRKVINSKLSMSPLNFNGQFFTSNENRQSSFV